MSLTQSPTVCRGTPKIPATSTWVCPARTALTARMRRLSWAEGESVRVSVFMHQAYTIRNHDARYILL